MTTQMPTGKKKLSRFGIDLGIPRWVIESRKKNNQTRANRLNDALAPSVVYFKKGTWYVGQPANDDVLNNQKIMVSAKTVQRKI